LQFICKRREIPLLDFWVGWAAFMPRILRQVDWHQAALSPAADFRAGAIRAGVSSAACSSVASGGRCLITSSRYSSALRPCQPVEIYDLDSDAAESNNLAEAREDPVAQAEKIFATSLALIPTGHSTASPMR